MTWGRGGVQQKTFGYNIFCLPFNLWSYCTCIALIKWNSIKTSVMRLLSLLGIIRLASPGNNRFHSHLFPECPLASTFAQQLDLTRGRARTTPVPSHPGISHGSTEVQAVLKTPVDKETLSFLCKQENGCLATITQPSPHREEGGDHTFPALCLRWTPVSHKLELISLVSLELFCYYQLNFLMNQRYRKYWFK